MKYRIIDARVPPRVARPAAYSAGRLISRQPLRVYDPNTGSYRYNYGLIIEIAGGVTFVLAMLWFFALELRDRWRTRRRAAEPALPATGVML